MTENNTPDGAPTEGPETAIDAETATPAVPAAPAPGPQPVRMRDQVWSFKTLVVVAAASVILGGAGGAAIVAVAHHDDGGGHARFGRGDRPMDGPGMRGNLRHRLGNGSQQPGQQPGQQPPVLPGQPRTPAPSANATP